MSSAITLGKNFDASKMKFGDVKAVGKQGAKIVYVSYNDKPLILQTPEMTSPFGISKFNADQKGAADKFSLGLSFKNREYNTSMQKFFDSMVGFDNAMLDAAIDNSMAWFKSNYKSREVVEALYTPTVKFAKDKQTMEITDKYPPTIRLSLPVKDGKISVDCFDDNRQPMELSENVDLKGSKITAIIQCSGVWLVGGNKFVPTWKVLQLKVRQNSSAIKGFAFKDDDEDAGETLDAGEDETHDIEDEPSVTSKAPVSKPTPAPADDVLPESDEEEDELEKKPMPVKKSIVVKKKVAA